MKFKEGHKAVVYWHDALDNPTVNDTEILEPVLTVSPCFIMEWNEEAKVPYVAIARDSFPDDENYRIYGTIPICNVDKITSWNGRVIWKPSPAS